MNEQSTPTGAPETNWFPKIPRLNREIIITEKIDGSNACVVVWNTATMGLTPANMAPLAVFGDTLIGAKSRTRFICWEDDNYGFATWVKDHAEELLGLGPGRHYGEWWGHKINRGYGQTERHFSLFDVMRWDAEVADHVAETALAQGREPKTWVRPPGCCLTVPVLYIGAFGCAAIQECLLDLRTEGSSAAPGWTRPEGIVIYHTAARSHFKITLEHDEAPKGEA